MFINITFMKYNITSRYLYCKLFYFNKRIKQKLESSNMFARFIKKICNAVLYIRRHISKILVLMKMIKSVVKLIIKKKVFNPESSKRIAILKHDINFSIVYHI